MKKIAIIFLGNHLYDGRCINMISALAQNNNKITIYSLHNLGRSTNTNPLINEISINLTSIPVLKYISWTKTIYTRIKKQSYDIIIAADLYSLIPISMYTGNYRIIYDSRELYTKLSAHVNHPIKNCLLSILEKFCMKRINQVMVSAKSDQEYLEHLYANYSIVYKIIYNYPKKALIKTDSTFLRDKFKISKHKLILLYQGVIQKNRGILQLIKIIQNTTNTVGVIIGRGQYKQYLKKYLKKKQLHERVLLIPAMTYCNLLRITSSADVGISLIKPQGLSNKYALPNKLFEYALAGIPVLGSALPNMKKHIIPYNLGWCVGAEDLSKQIEIIEDYQRSQRKGFINKVNINDLFSWESQQNGFYNFILNNE